MQLTGNTILITGGGSGIGASLAERFANEGNKVIICGRRENALAEAARRIPGLVTHAVDLAERAGREELSRWIREQHPETNVLINNAGVQNWMDISDDDFAERADQELAINVQAPVHLSHLMLKHPALTTIINVSSGLAFVPLVRVPVYCATKAFLHSFTLSLRELCRARNVEVIELIPPALNTDLGGKGLHDFAPAVAGFIDAVFEQLAQGKLAATYGFTEAMNNAGQEVFAPIFQRMNHPQDAKR
jgi:uncharacterized oxidoreductase